MFYKYSEIDENIYRISSAEGVYMDLFVGSEKALLLDTGYGFGDLKSIVKKITEKPLYIVNSHGHIDHIGGNVQFDEIPYMNSLDLPVAELHSSKRLKEGAVRGAKEFRDWAYEGVRNILPADFDETQYLNARQKGFQQLFEGMIFDLGNIHLKVYEVPGHTPGSIALCYEEKKWLYLADSMNPFVLLYFNEATNLSTYVGSIKKMQQIKADRLYIGHDEKALHADNLDLFLRCAQTIDFEHGESFCNPLFPEAEGRICAVDGFTIKDMGKPGFAAIVISKEKLN